MRVTFAVVTLIAMMSAFAPAHAEKRIFIVGSGSSGYGVDTCLTTTGKCGEAVAASYCHRREFSKAVSYRTVDRDDITGAIPGEKENCPRGVCEAYVAIECSR